MQGKAKILSVRWGWVLALTLVGNALGATQTVITARPLLDDEAMGYRAVYLVDLERRGSDTRGALILRDPGRGEQVYPLDLAARARKRIYLSVTTTTRSALPMRFRAPRLEWRGENGERQSVELPALLQLRVPIVVVGDMLGGLERLNQQQTRFTSEASLGGAADRPQFKVYYRRPAELPDESQPLLELPMIALVGGAETLSAAQWRALQQWLVAGGSLMVSVGSFGPSIKTLPVASLLPTIQFAESPSGLATLDSDTEDWHPAALDEARRPVLYWRRVGLGNLYLFMGNLEQPEWRNWNGLPEMVETIALSSAFPSERLSRQFDGAASREQQRTRYAQPTVGAIALIVYAALVWNLTAWLRRRRRLASVFAPLSALTLLVSGAIFVFPPRAEVSEPVVFTWLYPGETGDGMEIGYGYASLEAGRHTLRLPDGAVLLEFAASPNAAVQTRYPSASPIVEVRCPARTHIGVCFVRFVDDPPRLEVRRQGNTLLIRNLSSQPLNSVQVFARSLSMEEPSVLWQRVRLQPGHSATATIVQENLADYIWVQAFYDRRGAPLMTLNDAPMQEVNTLCVFAP